MPDRPDRRVSPEASHGGRASVVWLIGVALLTGAPRALEGLAPSPTLQQAASVVTGSVVGGASENPLSGVTIQVEGTGLRSVSRGDGSFVLRGVPEGSHVLVFSLLGLATTTVDVSVGPTPAPIDIGLVVLEAAPVALDQIVVTPGSFTMMDGGPAARLTLRREQIVNMAWAEDITRAVTRLPGISSSDYSSNFSIRGGEADEVLITLDGMELIEPFHQRDYSGGLFSIVDIETIQGVDLLTGGFPAQYGNRLSGVLEMRSRRNVDGERHTTVGLSPMNVRLYTEGAFSSGRGSYLFSARRGMLDLAFTAVGLDENLPSFYDMMAKVDFDLSPTHTLSAHGLWARDEARVRDIAEDGNFDRNDTSYGNSYAWLTLSSSHGADLTSRTLLYTGAITHDRRGAFNKYEPSDKGTFTLSDQRDYTLFGLKSDWRWLVSDALSLSAGAELRRVRSTYDYSIDLQELRVDSAEQLLDFSRVEAISTDPSGHQVGAYVGGRLRVAPRLVLESGLRYDATSYTDDRNWSPRAGLAYVLTPNTTLRGAIGRYYQSQFLYALDVNNGNDTFHPAGTAEHYALGLEHRFGNGVEMRVDAYHKDVSRASGVWQNLRDHLEMFPEQRNDNALVVTDGAVSRGVELFLKYDLGDRVSWWFSYALASAEDHVTDIQFDGLLTERTGWVPRLNDQRHTVFADVNYRPNDRWHLNLSWQYHCCWPRTDYTYRIQTLPNTDLHFYPVHAAYNGTTYPAYHRMDVRVNRRFSTDRGDVTVFLHVINLYNRENLKKFDLDTRNDAEEYSLDEFGNYVPFRDDTYWLGLLPVLGFSWSF